MNKSYEEHIDANLLEYLIQKMYLISLFACSNLCSRILNDKIMQKYIKLLQIAFKYMVTYNRLFNLKIIVTDLSNMRRIKFSMTLISKWKICQWKIYKPFVSLFFSIGNKTLILNLVSFEIKWNFSTISLKIGKSATI